ncbi:MAG: hypothetical protein OXF79_29165 [Chloroflexi bacterium]|nr:hypothetical protein [Chloroflexota bacterium]
MPEKERHQNLKRELLRWMQDDVQPQFGRHMTEIAFQCNDHIHFWRLPPWAAFVDEERRMPHPDGGHFQPDVVILDYQAKPIGVLEVKHTNRSNKVTSAALRLQIPYFRFDCPATGATEHELWVRQNENPWFSENTTSFHASWEGEVREDGEVVYPGPIRVSGNQPGQVIMGKIAWANATNLTCEGASWLQKREDGWGWATHYRDKRLETARKLGTNLLWEIETRRQNPYHWNAGIGDVQLAGTIGIYPLNKDYETGKYLPVDVTSLLQTWGEETMSMHRALTRMNDGQQSRPSEMFVGGKAT